MQLLMQITQLSKLHTWSQALFNEIIICAIFIFVNAIQKFLSHELTLVIHSYCQHMSKSICIYQDCASKGFMFTIKEVWNRVCSPENQFFNTNSWKWPSTSSLKSFTWFWRFIDELSLYSFFPSACPAHDVTNFIDFDWLQHLFRALLDLKLLIFKPL